MNQTHKPSDFWKNRAEILGVRKSATLSEFRAMIGSRDILDDHSLLSPAGGEGKAASRRREMLLQKGGTELDATLEAWQEHTTGVTRAESQDRKKAEGRIHQIKREIAELLQISTNFLKNGKLRKPFQRQLDRIEAELAGIRDQFPQDEATMGREE